MKPDILMSSRSDNIKLCDLGIGQGGIVADLNVKGSLRRRLLDLGLSDGAKVICVGKSPMGDPKAFLIRGAVIALRSRECAGIAVVPISEVR